jgi:hypothetical protein
MCRIHEDDDSVKGMTAGSAAGMDSSTSDNIVFIVVVDAGKDKGKGKGKGKGEEDLVVVVVILEEL